MDTSRAHRLALAMIGGFVLAASLAACSSEPESQPDAEAAVCDSVAAVRSAVAQVAALDSTSTVSDAESAREALTTAVEGLETSAANLESADTTAISAATDEISSAVGDVSGSDTLGEAASAVQGSTGTMDTALTEISDRVQCE